MQAHPQTLVSFFAYAAAIVALAIVAFRRIHSESDFFLGGRQLPYWITALSAGASDMSAWLLLGLPGLAYVALVESIWLALGLLFGAYINWLLVAKRLREQSQAYGDSLTLPEFFDRRVGGPAGLIKRVSAVFILIFFLFYTAAGFVAGAKLFASTFGFDYTFAVGISAALVTAYTSFGGFLAVAWTDALQATLMFVALLLVAGLACAPMVGGGVGAAPESSLINLESVSVIGIASSLAWGLGYFGQPHILQRFMAIRHSAELSRARRLATAWTGASLCAAVAVGMGAHAQLPAALEGANVETVFIVLSQLLLHPLIAGICLAAILAAIMSTADSQLLVAASSLTHDLVPDARSSSHPLMRHRIAVIVICMVSTALALDSDAKVLDLVAYAWAGFGATLGPVVLFTLYVREVAWQAVFAAMCVGAVTVLVWELRVGGLFDLYALLPGFLAAIVTLTVCNVLFQARDLEEYSKKSVE